MIVMILWRQITLCMKLNKTSRKRTLSIHMSTSLMMMMTWAKKKGEKSSKEIRKVFENVYFSFKNVVCGFTLSLCPHRESNLRYLEC